MITKNVTFKLIINFPIQIIEKDEDWMLVKIIQIQMELLKKILIEHPKFENPNITIEYPM